MSSAHQVTIPLLNPNEPEALLVSLLVKDGQKVKTGDLLCSLETTKSTADLLAEASGFLIGLIASEGDTLRAGETLCYIAPKKDWQPPAPAPSTAAADSPQLPPGLRITQPALQAAQDAGLDLTALPIGPLLTEIAIQDIAAGEAPSVPNLTAPEDPFDPSAILVYGGSGHGKSVIELIQAAGEYAVHGLIDDGMSVGEQVLGHAVLGGRSELPSLHTSSIRQAANAVGGIGDIMSRVRVFQQLAGAGFYCPPIIHPTAFVEPSAQLAPGVQVFPHAYIGSDARIGFGAIVNTGAVVSHDCVLSDYVNLAPGGILAGGVSVGEAALIGMGVTVNLGVSIGARTRIGNSAVLKSDLPDSGVVRAGGIWPD
ncbi:MAG: NeuD/PglB/VioB family sugar acetyltransferase [Anaerolineae bacterium]|nr:NeuD/PglB/VioB family sugar acetyltransferase [Anaerolineae bacterium]